MTSNLDDLSYEVVDVIYSAQKDYFERRHEANKDKMGYNNEFLIKVFIEEKLLTIFLPFDNRQLIIDILSPFVSNTVPVVFKLETTLPKSQFFKFKSFIVILSPSTYIPILSCP